MALLIYKLDAIKRFSKDLIKQKIMDEYGEAFFSQSKVLFDLETIDYFRQKGFTRYYPFCVNGEPYIIRIFRADERCFQPEIEILYEGSIEKPPVTFQILRGVNSILEHCELKPCEMPSQFTTEVYP